MGYDLGIFRDGELRASFIEWLVDERWGDIQNHFGKFWDYYHNRSEPTGAAGESGRPYVQAQECGLPSRITGTTAIFGRPRVAPTGCNAMRRKEVVIENDITWRVNALVDFLFGKEIQIVSKAADGGQTRRNRGDTKGALCG